MKNHRAPYICAGTPIHNVPGPRIGEALFTIRASETNGKHFRAEGKIMKLGGWRTRLMFDRYNIIGGSDLTAAVAKRFGNEKARASKDAPTGLTPLVSCCPEFTGPSGGTADGLI